MAKLPEGKRDKMSVALAYDWLAYVSRLPVDDIKAVVDRDVARYLADGIERNPQVNTRLVNEVRKVPLKVADFVCHCGCGQVFRAEYRTKHPKYLNDAHKQRAYRRRRAAVATGRGTD